MSTKKAKSQLNENQKKLYDLVIKHGEDPAKWLALYQIESDSGENMGTPSIGSHSDDKKASGHFQIKPEYFKDYNITREGTRDLETSFVATKNHHDRHSKQLQQKLGRELTAGEYYLGHQQGWCGARVLLSHPNENVVDVLASMKGYDRQKAIGIVRRNDGRLDMTAGEFSQKWINEANRLQQEYTNLGYGRPAAQKNAALTQQPEAENSTKQHTHHIGIEPLKNQTTYPEINVMKVFQAFSDKFPKPDAKADGKNENEQNNNSDNTFDLK